MQIFDSVQALFKSISSDKLSDTDVVYVKKTSKDEIKVIVAGWFANFKIKLRQSVVNFLNKVCSESVMGKYTFFDEYKICKVNITSYLNDRIEGSASKMLISC
jgi:hypothetical protein